MITLHLISPLNFFASSATQRRLKPWVVLAVLLPAFVGLLIPPAAHARVPRYTITDLGSFSNPATVSSSAIAINGVGQVAYSTVFYDATQTFRGFQAFLYSDGALTNLGNLGTDGSGYRITSIVSINNAGQVVGQSSVYDSGHNFKGQDAFLYTGGVLTDLGNLGTDSSGYGSSFAAAINNNGQIVGYSDVNDARQTYSSAAFLYAGGRMISLGNLGTASSGYSYSSAAAINAAGVIVGSSNVYDVRHNLKGTDAFVYAKGVMTDLGNFGTDGQGQGSSSATGINNAGLIIGTSNVYDANYVYKGFEAFLYSGGRMVSLGNLGIDSSGFGSSDAEAINDAGQIAGGSEVYDATHNDKGRDAYLFSNGRMIDLGSLSADSSGKSFSSATTLNNAGQIIGYYHDFAAADQQSEEAFLYSGGVLYDLRSLITNGVGWTSLRATGINDAGQIVGSGTHNGQQEGFLLTPQPGHTHVLWTNTSGQISLWNYDAVGGTYGYTNYGPFAGWSVKALADGADGKTRVLWTTAAGRASLWSLNNATGVYTHYEFGPFAGWTAGGVSVSKDNTTHVLWTNTNGTVSLWNYDAVGGTYGYLNYGPFPGWSAAALADGPDGKARVLWDTADGTMSLWSLDNASGLYAHHEFGPYPGWTDHAISVGLDNTTHVLWTNTDGRLSLWNYDAVAGTYGYLNYGPFAGWSVKSVADGSDGGTRVLWTTATGQVSLWSLDNTSGVYTNHEFGPFAGWTATAIAAP